MRRRKTPEPAPMFDIWDRYSAKVVGEAEARVQAQNRALEHERQAGRMKRRKLQSPKLRPRVALTEIAALIQSRHGGPCDTDDGAIYFQAAIPFLISAAGSLEAEERRDRLFSWAKVLTPRLTEAEAIACIEAAEARNERGKLFWTAQDLGDLLRLTVAEREALEITSARPCGMSGKQFAAYQRKRKTMREKARRAANGAKPREQSDACLIPWKALGVSRRTYYRRLKAETAAAPENTRGTNSCPADTKYLKGTTEECQPSERASEGPARQASASRNVSAGGHSPRGKTRAVRQGHAEALPFSMIEISEQPDLLGEGWIPLGEAAGEYVGGLMPPDLALAVRVAQRARMMKQEEVARHVGISRPQMANALKGRFGLSRSAAANLMGWLRAA